MVVRLGLVHALEVLPRNISHQTQAGHDDGHEVELRQRKDHRDDVLVFSGEANQGRQLAVGGDEDQPEEKTADDGEEGPFRPDVGNKCRFAQSDDKDGGVETGTPGPVAGGGAVGACQVTPKDELRYYIGDQGMVETVEDPAPERVHFKKDAFLAKLVQLWVAVEKASGNELVKDTHRQWRSGREEEIVE